MDALQGEPIARPPSAWRTGVVWLALVGMYAGLWIAPERMDLLMAIGLGVAAVVAGSWLVGQDVVLPALVAPLAAAALAMMVGGETLAIASGGGSLGAATGGLAARIARNAWYRRRLRAVQAAAASGRIAGVGEQVALWPSLWFYAATGALIEHRHAAAALRLLRARPRTMRADPTHAMQLVHVLLALGRVEEARATVDSIAALTPNGRELRGYLDARVLVAEDRAERVLARSIEPEEGAHAAWTAYRRIALADACAACGDRDAARRHLASLPAPQRDRYLAQLRDSNRPAAPLAAELLAGTAQPYR